MPQTRNLFLWFIFFRPKVIVCQRLNLDQGRNKRTRNRLTRSKLTKSPLKKRQPTKSQLTRNQLTRNQPTKNQSRRNQQIKNQVMAFIISKIRQEVISVVEMEIFVGNFFLRIVEKMQKVPYGSHKIADFKLCHGTSCNMSQALQCVFFLIQLMLQTNPKRKLMIRNKQTRGRNLLRNQLVNQQQLKHRLSHLLNQLQNNRKQVSYTSFYVSVDLFV